MALRTSLEPLLRLASHVAFSGLALDWTKTNRIDLPVRSRPTQGSTWVPAQNEDAKKLSRSPSGRSAISLVRYNCGGAYTRRGLANADPTDGPSQPSTPFDASSVFNKALGRKLYQPNALGYADSCMPIAELSGLNVKIGGADPFADFYETRIVLMQMPRLCLRQFVIDEAPCIMSQLDIQVLRSMVILGTEI
ncbi:hypothetical protein C8Q70DRAFT_932377 [Cubamyces menziesii]|nr:hypothetical protein C8Q70DRAFT_932377 [Cubamyces menziesii]